MGHGSQEPQCCGSVPVTTQRSPHRVGAPGGQVSLQTKLLPAGTQSGAVAAQLMVQEPQWAGSARSVSQPGAPVQSPKPARHAFRQLPRLHVTWLPSTCGRSAQSLSQLPQWRGSLARLSGSQAAGWKPALLLMHAERQTTASAHLHKNGSFM
jgi:hypothetical protein